MRPLAIVMIVCFVAVVVAFRIKVEIEKAHEQALIHSVIRWRIEYKPRPESVPGARYAIATIMSWKSHELAAMTLCWSLKRAQLEGVELVVIAAERDGNEPPDPAVLARCFDRVLQRASVLPRAKQRRATIPNAVGSLDVLRLFELDEYRRIVFLETDVVAVRPSAIVELVKTPLRFAAVQSTISDGLWQGGVAAFEPNPQVLGFFLEVLQERLDTEPNFDSEKAFSERFRHEEDGVLVLPQEFNIEPIYVSHASHMDAPVAMHYSLRKPWVSKCKGSATYWHKLAREAALAFDLPEQQAPSLRARVEDWMKGWAHSCGEWVEAP